MTDFQIVVVSVNIAAGLGMHLLDGSAAVVAEGLAWPTGLLCWYWVLRDIDWKRGI